MSHLLKFARKVFLVRGVRVLIVLALGLGSTLIYLLLQASSNTPLFAEGLPMFLGMGAGVTVALLLLIGYQLLKIRRRVRARVFGSKLTLRLVLLFSLVAVLPGILVYGVSVQFLARSIESWFDVRVDKALEGGLSLGRITLEANLENIRRHANTMSLSLAESKTTGEQVANLNSLREQTGVFEATLFTSTGAILAFSSNEPGKLVPEKPQSSELRLIRLQREYAAIEETADYSLQLRVVVPVNQTDGTTSVLQLVEPVAAQLAHDAAMVEQAYGDYQELTLSRQGLTRLYTLALTLSFSVALLSALLLAVLFSERLSAPLGFLAAGTRAVAKGDFSQRHPVRSDDELGILTDSFNNMTQQLAEVREAAQKHETELSRTNAYLENVLGNLSAGVISFDNQFQLRSANRSAAKILGASEPIDSNDPTADLGSSPLWLVPVVTVAKKRFGENDDRPWQQQIELETQKGKQVLLLRGSRLLAAGESGFVLVFDDVTHLMQAQRYAAWGEVAQRLAHEIKNPLTPIQLSAERLQNRLIGKLDSAAGEFLSRATKTISNQVAALKSLVDAFSQYSSPPQLDLTAVELNSLVREVLELYAGLAIKPDSALIDDELYVRGDSARLRQVIHNLLQNAQQAVAEISSPNILVETQVASNFVKLEVSDNGAGFPDDLMARVFEPYVTTKAKGTGLGLAIVKKIVEEHNGSIQLTNKTTGGAMVTVSLPIADKKEGAQGESTAIFYE